MILKRLVVPGDFVEAHLYFDFLWLIDAGGAVRALDLSGFIAARLNGSGAAAHKLFARNDLLVSRQGSTFAREQTPDVQQLLQSSDPITISPDDINAFSYHYIAQEQLEQPLDVRFYSGRAFVGVPGALVQFPAPGKDGLSSDFRRGAGEKPLGLKRVFDEGTPTQIQCRFGSVNFACGPEGGFIGLGALSIEKKWEPRPTKIAATSFFTEVNRAGIGHVGAEAQLHLSAAKMRNTHGPAQNDDQREQIEVAEVGAEDERAMLRAELATRAHRSSGAVPERMFLTTSKALVVMSDDSLGLFAYEKDGEFLHTKAQVRYVDPPPGRILATTTTCGKIVVECDDNIFVLNNWKWRQLFDEPVYSVRGYPASRWYRQLLTIVAEGRTELVFICED